MANNEQKPQDIIIWLKNGKYLTSLGCTDIIVEDDGLAFIDKYGVASGFFKRNIAGFSMKDSKEE